MALYGNPNSLKEPTPDPNAGTVMTDSGTEVDGGMNLKALRNFANMVYPTTETPQMEYGPDVNINIPFTKRSLFKVSGKKMDKLAGALAAAAQGAYVPGSDPGGQFLKGFLQGYGGVRAQGYAERKKEYETQKAANKANLEARSKLIGQLGLEGYKALMKPKVDPNAGKVLITPRMVDEAKSLGIAVPAALVGQYVAPGEFIRSVPDTSVADATKLVARQAQNQAQASQWVSNTEYQNYSKVLGVYKTAQNIMVSPSGGGDVALVKLVERAVDPATGVREADVKAWMDLNGLIGGMNAAMNKAKGKKEGFLPDNVRSQVYAIIENMHTNSRSNLESTAGNMRRSASRNGFDPEVYGIPDAPPPLVREGPGVVDPNVARVKERLSRRK